MFEVDRHYGSFCYNICVDYFAAFVRVCSHGCQSNFFCKRSFAEFILFFVSFIHKKNLGKTKKKVWWNLRYKLSDGQTREETGTLRNINGSSVYVATGFYTFIGTDGQKYRVDYLADENGFSLIDGKRNY